ncbi:MAG: ExbD/TolR family protein [Kiritimatiellia bacterium]|nr:biopolymer transporter ExbD [Lentisphaerota bacterium]
MRRRTSSLNAKELNEISTTPLIDISMLLLVTFLITYPLMEHGLHVNLPKGKADELQPLRASNITLDAAGQLFLDERPIDAENLQLALEGIAREQPETTVFVRADRDLKYAQVIEVMRMLHAANLTRMALVTRAE